MVKIGVIGMSPGNGHPYSWSAIINGDYNEKAMQKQGELRKMAVDLRKMGCCVF